MLFALVAAPGCRRSPRAARPEARRVVVITGADGRATRRENWAPGKMSSPIKHELPCVKSEPALMTRPGERVCQRVRRRQAP